MTNTVSPRIQRALISVADKSEIVPLAQVLINHNIQILSTGGTAKLLSENQIPHTLVSDYTGSPEVFGGRVKTLHPKIHGGILANRASDNDLAQMKEYDIGGIDLVIVNLYPFAKVTSDKNCDWPTAIENIDIGGPTMLRAAAKNHQHVTVVTDSSDYTQLIEMLNHNDGSIDAPTRKQLAYKAFAHTASYDVMISDYFAQNLAATEQTILDSSNQPHSNNDSGTDNFPQQFTLSVNKTLDLRYGENPHQQAAFYRYCDAADGSLANAQLLQGKALSYNNIADADAALSCVQSFAADVCACVIVKHANPCGVAVRANQVDAYQRAFATDPQSSFGGIIAFNQAITAQTADTICANQFAEVIIAPAIDEAALSVFAQKKNLRVLITGQLQTANNKPYIKPVSGGLLIQDADNLDLLDDKLHCVSKRQASPQELIDLKFAWKVVKSVKSNAIVYAQDNATIGVGAGQMSRINSALIAQQKANDANLIIPGSVMASDAFFPFRDGIDAAAQAGIRAIIQPGGSIRDEEVIAAADEADIAMLFTGIRHFYH